MNLFVDSLVTLGDCFLIPCKEVAIFHGVLVVTDVDNVKFDFKLDENEFLVINHDPVE